jgi:hypothetical protein
MGTPGRINRQKMLIQSSVSQPVTAGCNLTAVRFQPVQVCILQAAAKCKSREIFVQAWTDP